MMIRQMIDDLHKFKKAYRSAETDEIQSRLGGHSGWLKCMQAGLRADQGRAGWQGLTAERTLGQPGWELSWIFYKEHLSAELGWAWVETTGWDYFEKLSESEDWNPAESVEFFNLLEHFTSLKILEKRSRTLSAENFFLLYSVKGTKISGDSVHERNSRILRAVVHKQLL